MSLCKPKAVYAASEQQYTAAGGGVQVPRVVFTCDGKRSARRLIHGLVKLTQFCVNFIALWPQNGACKHRNAISFQIDLCSDPYLWS